LSRPLIPVSACLGRAHSVLPSPVPVSLSLSHSFLYLSLPVLAELILSCPVLSQSRCLYPILYYQSSFGLSEPSLEPVSFLYLLTLPLPCLICLFLLSSGHVIFLSCLALAWLGLSFDLQTFFEIHLLFLLIRLLSFSPYTVYIEDLERTLNYNKNLAAISFIFYSYTAKKIRFM
jgi:hypothetical protein